MVGRSQRAEPDADVTALPSCGRFTLRPPGQFNNGYLLINALMIPTTAYLIKRYTTRQLYLTASLIFIIGSLIGATAPIYPILIIGRMIQALGAGIIIPLVNVVVMTSTKPSERGAAMGIVGLALNLAPVLGPTVAGVILTHLSWQYLLSDAAIMLVDVILAPKFCATWGAPQATARPNGFVVWVRRRWGPIASPLARRHSGR